MKQFDQTEGEELTETLLTWFTAHQRPLPWRERYAPYGVWISEIMLQQTQMDRGVNYFLSWMDRFPDVAAVAAASEEEILHAWEGLGYYRRARFLHAAAKAIMERHGGQMPEDEKALSALPGLGAYTVAAIRGIAFNHNVAVVDANVERVFSRLLNLDSPPKKKQAANTIRAFVTRLLPAGHAREYNQAMMEFGALICTKAPRCEICPLTRHCESRRLGLERERPVLKTKAAIIPVLSGHGLLIIQGRVLIVKRSEGGLWGGLWEFPGSEVLADELPEQAARRAFANLGLNTEQAEKVGLVSHGYTNHRLTAHFFRVQLATEEKSHHSLGMDKILELIPRHTPACFVDCRKTSGFAMPAHHRKLADRYFSDQRQLVV